MLKEVTKPIQYSADLDNEDENFESDEEYGEEIRQRKNKERDFALDLGLKELAVKDVIQRME